MKKYTKLSRHVIETVLDDELDQMFKPVLFDFKMIPASEAIKKDSEKYQELFLDYCDRNHILITSSKDGEIEYLEEQE